MKSAGKARNNGLYRHIRTSKEIIRNLLNDSDNNITDLTPLTKIVGFQYLYANGNQISQIPDFRGTHLKLYENYGISETGETTRTPIVMFSGNPEIGRAHV